ncbi:MAG: hypothetical protein ACE5I3_05760 [Phycisphaerae bacterium]
MACRHVSLRVVPSALSLLLVGGCPEAGWLIPGLNTVEVELINDTGFPVDPNIRFDDDSGFFARLAPAERLSTGLIEPGQAAAFRFDCDELGLIFSDEAEQVLPLFADYVADATEILERDEEYDCGDLIRFRFVGNAEDFGVVVSVNGRVVD